ncbi:MAG: hypothetical protein HFJ55_01270 [Clostridia bacterium]|nr:hypothetical protein [Clostridia bacterium]
MKDFWAEELQNQRKGKLKKLALFIGFIAIILLIIILIMVYMYNSKFRRWCDDNVLKKEVREENTRYIEIDGDENTQMYAYDKYICIFRKKTLEFYNKMGNQVGKIELDINKAVFATAGKYMAICEEQGQKFYLINGKEKLYENSIEGNINQINVSEGGYISIVLSNSSYKSIVDVYNKSGEKIFKTNLVTSRVTDVSISKDSQYLAMAEIDISGMLIKSSIQIVSMELARTNPEEAIVYKHEAPTGKLIINIEYQKNNNLICMYDDSIEMIRNNQNKELFTLKNKKISFMTVNSRDRITILEEISTGEYTSDTKSTIINPITLKTREYIAKGVAKKMRARGNRIAINFGLELHIIDLNGIVIKKYISETEISDIVMTENLVGIIYRNKIQILNI